MATWKSRSFPVRTAGHIVWWFSTASVIVYVARGIIPDRLTALIVMLLGQVILIYLTIFLELLEFAQEKQDRGKMVLDTAFKLASVIAGACTIVWWWR